MKSNNKNTPHEFSLKVSKELFIETMEAIKKQYEHDRACSEAFCVILPNDYISCYDNNAILSQLIKFLIKATNDHEKDGAIEYFIWELEFGKKYTNESFKIGYTWIKLATIEDLWNLLLFENNLLTVEEIEVKD